MRFWLVPLALVLGAALVWWVRRRTAATYVEWLIRRAHGQPQRARRAVIVTQVAGLVAAILVLAVAVLAEQWNRWFWLRIPLCVLVIATYVPLAVSLAPARFRWQRSAAMKALERGASVPVADAIARAGKVFAPMGSVVFLISVLLLSWHHLHP
ncbi:hypothetical protein [Branchiibius cervicis]|uniref:DUF2269 family protein n=1 Tax=Branchiibius cervicis TaxID=908252 RepID=A0ABW2AWE1_9MICO